MCAFHIQPQKGHSYPIKDIGSSIYPKSRSIINFRHTVLLKIYCIVKLLKIYSRITCNYLYEDILFPIFLSHCLSTFLVPPLYVLEHSSTLQFLQHPGKHFQLNKVKPLGVVLAHLIKRQSNAAYYERSIAEGILVFWVFFASRHYFEETPSL